MGKSKQPRKRKAAASAPAPAPVAAPGIVVESPKQDIVVHSAPAPPAVPPLLFQVVETLRMVAERMIDIADATAEAVTKRLSGRALD